MARRGGFQHSEPAPGNFTPKNMKKLIPKLKVAWRILWADSSFVVTRRREVVKPYPDFDNDDPIVDTVYDLACRAMEARIDDEAIQANMGVVKEILGGGK